MAIDFPNSPTVGQIFTSGGATWEWDGAKWTAAPTGSTDAPTDGKLYERQNQAWALDPIQTDVPDTNNYVRQQGLWVPEVSTFGGGFLNKLRNGTFDVWQRGTAAAVPPSPNKYTADGWQVVDAGTACSVGQGARIGQSLYSLSIVGIAGNTGESVYAKVESMIAAPLSGRICTFQCALWNSTGATITPALTLSYPNAADNWSASTVFLSAVNLQPCPTGVTTKIAYTFTAAANVTSGMMLQLNVGAITSGNIAIADADLRATPGLPVGLCANPPPPELRPIHVTLAECQRYYEKSYDLSTNIGSNTPNGQIQIAADGLSGASHTAIIVTSFAVRKRIVPPTVMIYSATSGASGYLHEEWANADVAATLLAIGERGFSTSCTVPPSTGYNLVGHWTASAEL